MPRSLSNDGVKSTNIFENFGALLTILAIIVILILIFAIGLIFKCLR